MKAIIFEDALALAQHEWKKRGKIEKIILYSSYARGGWVDEPHTAKGYRSDFDILIIVHILGEGNDGLAHDRYFFMDVAKDGIALYEAGECQSRVPVRHTAGLDECA